MATIYNMIIVAHDETSTNDQRDLYAETGFTMLAGMKLEDFIKKCTSGSHPNVIQTKINAVKATGTITLSSNVATDTVTVNGTVFTAVSGAPSSVQYDISGGDTTGAASLAAQINATAALAAMVTATSALGVVTLTANVPGAMGNAFTLAISAHGSVSAARMASGANGDTETSHAFGSGF